MKKTILAAAMCISGSAFANMCEVDMVDIRTNRVITTIRSYDYNDSCKEAMKSCRLEIRKRNLLNRADCIRQDRYPTPTPTPYPYPNPNPNPYPGSMDARRMLNNGESVIMNNRTYTVMGMNHNGMYAVRSTDGWNTVNNNIRRENLSVTNGCNLNICTSESVINTQTARYETVAGISYDDDFVTRSTDGWNTLQSNVNRRSLAKTTGCIQNYYSQICVGNTVITNMNRYLTVVGIQLDGRVVLKSTDGWGTLSLNVDPSGLVVVR